MSSEDLTEPEDDVAYDFETKPLTQLLEEQMKEFKYRSGKGLMPDRDEVEGVYRCRVFTWEVEESYCSACNIWHQGIRETDDGKEEESSDNI
jgi:hypothetical protein